MGINTLMEHLNTIWGQDGAANLIRALRQDDLVWTYVCDEAGLRKVIDTCGNELEAWTPARIAISAIGDGKLARRLSAEPMVALDGDLRQTAVQTYEDVRKKGRFPVDLREAGLLGLALRERRRLTGSWKGLSDELVTAPSGVRSLNPRVWKTAITCLVGYIRDPQELLQELSGAKTRQAGLAWLLHVYIAHHGEHIKMRKAVEASILTAQVSFQLAFLKALWQTGFVDDARRLAAVCLERQPEITDPVSRGSFLDTSAEKLAGQLLSFQQLAALHHLAGNPAQANAAIELARKTLQYWDTGLTIQQTTLPDIEAGAHRSVALLEQIKGLPNVSSGFAGQVGKMFASTKQSEVDAGFLDLDLPDPILKIFKSDRVYAGKQKHMAREIALASANRLLDSLRDEQESVSEDFNLLWEPALLIEALMRMNLHQAAAQIADQLIANAPADASLLAVGCKAHANAGSLRRAYDLAEMIYALDQSDVNHLRLLATLSEQLSSWKDAFQYRKHILEAEKTEMVDDQIAYANAAMEAGEIDVAITCCEGLLAGNADLGPAHGLMGIARRKQGRFDEAGMHLNRATLVSPEVDRWWIALAELYDEQGDGKAAMDALKTAALAVPESARVHYELGAKYLENGQNAEALSHLKLAAAANPEDGQVAFKLSKAFHALGHLAEAKNAIEPLREKWAVDPSVAYEYGCIALDLGDVKGSLPALEIAAHSGQVEPIWLETLAQVLMNERTSIPAQAMTSRLQRAVELLEKAVALQPDHYHIKLSLAEAMRRSGNLAEAYELYQELAESQEVAWQDFLWKVQHGFGMTAIAMGQVESGIALLREASQNQPNDLMVLQDLTQACLDAQLNQDAEEAAEKALELAADDQQNLDWFAQVMLRLGKPGRSAEALRFAIELTPEKTDLRVRYAQLELENGAVESAREALANLCEMEDVDRSILRKAAYLHLRMQDYPQAIETLEKAVMVAEEPEYELLFELAQVYEKNGRIEDALRTIEQVSDACRDIKLAIFHADLLARQERYQSAITVAEKGVRHALESVDCGCETLLNLYNRLANWQRVLGNVASAYEQAEKALEQAPDDIGQRFLVAELAVALLQDKKAMKYALQPFEAANLILGENGLRLASLSAFLAIDDERIEDAQDLLVVCKSVDASDPWGLVLEARLAALNGDIVNAETVLLEAIEQLRNKKKEERSLQPWAARAAREAYRWDVAFGLLRDYQMRFASEHRGAYEMSIALVEAGEAKRICDELKIKSHAPAWETAGDFDQFERAFASIEGFLMPEEVIRWNTRAKLAQHPSFDTLQAFSMVAKRASDSATTMMGLRAIDQAAEAMEVGGEQAGQSTVLLQKMLALTDVDLEKSMQFGGAIVSSQPNHPLLLVAYARLAEKHGKNDVALDAIETALELWPDEELWQAWAARLAYDVGDMKTSIGHWQKALALQPEGAVYAAELGKVLFENGDYPLAEELMRKAISQNPDDAESWLTLAQTQAATGKSEQAIESALLASQNDPYDVHGFILASKIAQEMGSISAALQYARSAIQRKPNDIQAIVNLSQILRKQGAVAESLEVIERSMQEQVLCRELLIEHARLLNMIYGPTAAVEAVNKLTEAYPDDADILALHATVQAELGDLKNAERAAFRSLRINPNQPNLALTLGKMTRKAGQLDQAVHILSQAVSLDPHNVDVYLELGQTHYERREHGKALEMYKYAIKIAPQDPRGYYQAALIMKDTKDYVGAESMLEQAAKFAPEDLQVHRQLVGVMALNLIHKSQEAKTAL